MSLRATPLGGSSEQALAAELGLWLDAGDDDGELESVGDGEGRWVGGRGRVELRVKRSC